MDRHPTELGWERGATPIPGPGFMGCQRDFLHGRGGAHRAVLIERDATDGSLDSNAKGVGDCSLFANWRHVFDRQIHRDHVVPTGFGISIVCITVCAIGTEGVRPGYVREGRADKEGALQVRVLKVRPRHVCSSSLSGVFPHLRS